MPQEQKEFPSLMFRLRFSCQNLCLSVCLSGHRLGNSRLGSELRLSRAQKSCFHLERPQPSIKSLKISQELAEGQPGNRLLRRENTAAGQAEVDETQGPTAWTLDLASKGSGGQGGSQWTSSMS